MKKLLLSISILSVCFSAFAQRTPQRATPLSRTYPAQQTVAPSAGDEFPAKSINESTVSTAPSGNKGTAFSCTIGHTSYDLQSNGSSCNRIYSKNVGVAGTYTYSNDVASLSFADRGTGYNFSSTTACGSWGPQPTSRVETDRRGWPQIDYSETGGFEAFVSHNGDTSLSTHGIKLSKRSPAGTGSWVETEVPGADDDSNMFFLWPRMRIGGANGITIHEIDLSLPVANGGAIYHSMDGALTYSRSLDGGVTWDIRHLLLPDVDVAHFSGMNGDGYSIDVKGDVVAITTGAFDGDWCMWKSTDNGTTWTRTVIREFALPGFDGSVIGNTTDIDLDGNPDTLDCTDGYNAIIIDNNGSVHCWAGDMRMLDDGTTNGISFFPGTDGLLYWNESMGATPGSIPAIAFSPDRDGDSTLTFGANLGGGYQSCITSMPTAGIDANNVIYVGYTTLMENTDNGGGQSYRNAFITATSDGGATWSAPFNFVADDFTESVFPSMARDVGSCVPILWQWDGEPGLAVRIDMDPFGLSTIDYDCYPTSLFTGINDAPVTPKVLTVFPNPANDFVLLNYSVDKSNTANIKISNVLGELVYSKESRFEPGTNSIRVDITKYSAGVYYVNTAIGNSTYTAKFIVE
jgi:hypothetical protein